MRLALMFVPGRCRNTETCFRGIGWPEPPPPPPRQHTTYTEVELLVFSLRRVVPRPAPSGGTIKHPHTTPGTKLIASIRVQHKTSYLYAYWRRTTEKRGYTPTNRPAMFDGLQ